MRTREIILASTIDEAMCEAHAATIPPQPLTVERVEAVFQEIELLMAKARAELRQPAKRQLQRSGARAA